jgi:hypothetical protein
VRATDGPEDLGIQVRRLGRNGPAGLEIDFAKIIARARSLFPFLIDADPIAELRQTREENPEAFSALLTILAHYRRELRRLGLTSRDDLQRHYDAIRIAVLTDIIDTTPDGYRVDDARYLL